MAHAIESLPLDGWRMGGSSPCSVGVGVSFGGGLSCRVSTLRASTSIRASSESNRFHLSREVKDNIWIDASGGPTGSVGQGAEK